jgi:hypothetical protein
VNEHEASETLERQRQADLLSAQSDVVDLERTMLGRLLELEPAAARVPMAGGLAAEQVLDGNEQAYFLGAFVENPGPGAQDIYVGFEAGGADMRYYRVPGGTWKSIPRRFQNLSIRLADVTRTNDAGFEVQVTRLWTPPPPAAGLFDAAGSGAAATQVSGSNVVQVPSAAANTELAAANGARRALAVMNDSTATLFLKLGTVADPAASYTVKIPAGGYYELPQPIYTGQVDGTWSAANGNAYVTELS